MDAFKRLALNGEKRRNIRVMKTYHDLTHEPFSVQSSGEKSTHTVVIVPLLGAYVLNRGVSHGCSDQRILDVLSVNARPCFG